MDAEGNIVTKNEENIDVLNTFFASCFDSKTTCTQAPDLEDRDGEQDDIPVIQGDIVNNLLHHVGKHGPMGPDGIQRAGRRVHQVTFNCLSAVLAKQGSASGLKISKCGTDLQDWLERGSEQL